MSAQFTDYYQTLGVDRKATAKEIKSAYRALARKCHPDLNPDDADAERKFAAINEAYEVLDDPVERKKFDEIADYTRVHGRPPQASGGGYAADDAMDADANSFFEQFFGRRQSRATPRPGADIQAEITISLQEALHGTQRNLSLERAEACAQCGGAGFLEHGVCPVCRGRGATVVAQTLDVKIPVGVTNGSTIRLKGQGQPGAAGGPAGDLLLHTQIATDPIYQLKGHDLHREVEVSIFTAILGGDLPFEGLRGNLNLKLPAETQNGKVFRLKEQGLPRTGGKTSGDLYVKISLRIPTDLSDEQRESFRAARDSLEVSRAEV